jgi:NAD(P)H-quinone oxidoreductase subunit 2
MSTDFMEPLKAFIQNNNIELIGPELLLTIVIMVCVWHLSFSKTREERQDTWRIAVSGTVLTFIFLLVLWWTRYFENPAFQSVSVFKSAFGDGMFKADLFSLLIRTLLTLGTILVLFFTRNFIDKRADVPGEFYVIMLSALLGGMMLSGSTDLIMVFVSLETLSISSYILAGYMRGNILSAEAGLKYLLYGGMATAILLFGLSILYGFTGSTGFSEIAAAMPAYSTNPIVWSIMAIMIVGGICFKLSAAPFHMWAPDTYEGAPTPVVAFLSVVSKIAAFSLAIRFFSITFGMQEGWMGLISVLAVVSMVIGNVVALAQSNIKRLLAYSTVAHVGYLLLGLVVMTQAGLASLVYYLITYLFMNLGAFAVVTHFEDLTGRSDIAAYAGLMRKKPGLAFILSIMLLSLAGIPITAGFFGKFFLFQAVANAGSQYLWLVVVALLTSTISLYYYLNVIRLMVIAEPSEAVESLPVPASHSAKFSPVGLTMAVCLIGTIALGILADSFMQVSMSAVRGMSKPETYAVQPVQKPEISKAH